MSEIKPINVNSENYEEEVLKSEQPVVLDFWAPWCGPCRTIGPVLEELASTYEGRIKIVKVNVDEEPELAQSFRVSGIPALYVMKKGEVVDSMVGWGGKKSLIEAFDKVAGLAG